MNEINIKIQLKCNTVFPDYYVPQFCQLICNLLNTYEIETSDIYDLRLSQNVDFFHSPFIFQGKIDNQQIEKSISHIRNLSSSNPKDV